MNKMESGSLYVMGFYSTAEDKVFVVGVMVKVCDDLKAIINAVRHDHFQEGGEVDFMVGIENYMTGLYPHVGIYPHVVVSYRDAVLD